MGGSTDVRRDSGTGVLGVARLSRHWSRSGSISLVVGAWLALTIILAWVATAVPPLRIECGDVETMVCEGTVTAAQTRGLARPHPLILGASVSRGPAWPTAMGHRATVAFDLAGVPGTTTIRLYYDMGGHWGGVTDKGALEVVAWSLGWAAIVAAAGVGVVRGYLVGREFELGAKRELGGLAASGRPPRPAPKLLQEGIAT